MKNGRAEHRSPVVFVLPWSIEQPGGVNEVVRNLIRHSEHDPKIKPLLLEAGYAPTAADWKEWAGEDRLPIRVPSPWDGNSPVRGVASFLLRGPIAIAGLAQQLRTIQPEAINIHFPGLWALPLLAAIRIAVPSCRLVLSFHGADVNQIERASPLEKKLWEFLAHRSDAITCCSGNLLRRLESTLDIKGRGVVIHNGVDAATLDRELRNAAPLPNALQSRRYIVNVGTFEHKKGQDVLLHAFASLKVKHNDLALVLVGRSGPELENTRTLAASLGLKDSVLEFVDAPHATALTLIRHATLFALSSRQEPFGIVLLEAAYLRVPIVASNVGGIPEILRHEESGLLVTKESPSDLAAAIDRLIENKSVVEKVTKLAYEEVIAKFTGRQSYENYCAAIRSPIAQIIGHS